jgi:hypothetical protein
MNQVQHSVGLMNVTGTNTSFGLGVDGFWLTFHLAVKKYGH